MKTTEIRDYGDNEQIVVYTEDAKLQKILASTASYKQIYEKEDKIVGVDLYFPKDQKNSIKKQIKVLENESRKSNPTKQNKGASSKRQVRK